MGSNQLGKGIRLSCHTRAHPDLAIPPAWTDVWIAPDQAPSLTRARVLGTVIALPGQMLFGYRDDLNRVRKVGSSDVNAHLASIAGPNLTAKDFRTWWGTVSAAILFRQKPAANGLPGPRAQKVKSLTGLSADEIAVVRLLERMRPNDVRLSRVA